MIFEEKKDNYLISIDTTKLNVELIHDFLCNKSYWASGIPLENRNPDVYLTKPKD